MHTDQLCKISIANVANIFKGIRENICKRKKEQEAIFKKPHASSDRSLGDSFRAPRKTRHSF